MDTIQLWPVKSGILTPRSVSSRECRVIQYRFSFWHVLLCTANGKAVALVPDCFWMLWGVRYKLLMLSGCVRSLFMQKTLQRRHFTDTSGLCLPRQITVTFTCSLKIFVRQQAIDTVFFYISSILGKVNFLSDGISLIRSNLDFYSRIPSVPDTPHDSLCSILLHIHVIQNVYSEVTGCYKLTPQGFGELETTAWINNISAIIPHFRRTLEFGNGPGFYDDNHIGWAGITC